MEELTGSTVLHVVCEQLADIVMVNTVVEKGADVNAVRNDDKLPLTIIQDKIKTDPENDVLEEIKELLERKGALADWRNYRL